MVRSRVGGVVGSDVVLDWGNVMRHVERRVCTLGDDIGRIGIVASGPMKWTMGIATDRRRVKGALRARWVVVKR